jgi:histidyl-tRNA synthetase
MRYNGHTLQERAPLKDRQINRLPGMRDLGSKGFSEEIQDASRLSSHLDKANFQPVDTPLLEETELFTRKGGVELTGSLYAFLDPGGRRVSLRPEFTSSVIRCFVEQPLQLPARLRYSGPVFRYERGHGQTFRQYTQVGGEVIGAQSDETDAEIIHLACSGLESLGLDVSVRVGHLGALNELLGGFGLSEAANRFIIGNVSSLKEGSTNAAALVDQATQAGLVRASQNGGAHAEGSALGGVLQDVLGDAMAKPVGRRTSEEILARLRRKARDANDGARFAAGLEFVAALVEVHGTPKAALKELRVLAKARGVSGTPLDSLEALCAALAKRGLDGRKVQVDMALARGIAYYTGMIFELTSPRLQTGASLGGGGRYDGLVQALGGDDLPALGFAYDMDYVRAALGAHASEKATR